MIIVIDHQTVPPRMELEDSDVFDSLSVSLRVPDHVWLDRETLIELAGHIVDTTWLEKLDRMIGYAAGKGWLDDNGRIRVHLSIPDHYQS